MDGEITEYQKQIIAEIQRVSKFLGDDRLARRDFDKYAETTSASSASRAFGSWNRAVNAAGLCAYGSGEKKPDAKIGDEELLDEIIRIHRKIGKRPSQHELEAFGKFSPKPYRDRWGTWVRARELAYEKYGEPV